MAAVGIPLEKNRWRVPPDTTVQIIDPKNKKVKELYSASNVPRRNWKGIIIALLIIICVSLMVVAAVIIMSLYDTGPRIKGRRLTVQLFSSGELNPVPWNGSVVGSSQLLWVNEDGGLSVMDVVTGETVQVMANRTMRQIPVAEYSASSDLNYILLKHRHRPTLLGLSDDLEKEGHEYSIFSVKEERFYSLLGGRLLQHAVWNAVGPGIFVVIDNDIFWVKATFGMSPDAAVRLTSTGRANSVYNGVPDYLYSQEVKLTPHHTLRPSPNGTHVAFMTFNDTNVSETFFVVFGDTPPGASTGDIPRLHSIRFPMPGDTNPSVTVNVIPLDETREPIPDSTNQTIRMRIMHGKHKDFYVTYMEWMNDTELLVQTMDRQQKTTSFWSCSSIDGACKDFATHRFGAPTMTTPQERKTASLGEDVFAIVPVLDGHEGTFLHMVRISRKTKKATPITFGKMEVKEIVHVDPKIALFLASTVENPEEQHLYKVKNLQYFDGIECVSCKHSDAANCSFVSASAVPGSSGYFIKHCLGPAPPYSAIWKLDQNSSVKIVHENAKLVEFMAESAMPTEKHLKVPLGIHNWEASVEVTYPPIFRKEEGVKYPTVIMVKEDPSEKSVTTQFNFDLPKFLSASRDVLAVTIDARGTTGRGRNYHNALFSGVGQVDVDDIIHVARYLSNVINAIDLDNMVLLGFGYGGYVASMALARSNSPFICGGAIAPISAFSFYNSAFAERYFGNPNISKVNQRRYLLSEIMLQAEGLKERRLLLVHGSADIKVPLRHSMLLSVALTDNAVPFRQVVYPDQSHDLHGVQQHGVHLLGEFFDECFEEWSNKREALNDE